MARASRLKTACGVGLERQDIEQIGELEHALHAERPKGAAGVRSAACLGERAARGLPEPLDRLDQLSALELANAQRAWSAPAIQSSPEEG
jgi:hypothetical protein